MARPRKKGLISIGGKFEPGLATGLQNLAHSQGISMREALRRIMTQAILDGRIPGVSDVDLENHERDKWGESKVPVYDGEEGDGKASKTPQGAQTGKEPLS